MAHWEVLAVEFELLPHAHEQVQVEMVQQQVNGHVPLPARLQEVTQQLHVAEAVHDNSQGLQARKTKQTHTHTSDVCSAASRVHTCVSHYFPGLEMQNKMQTSHARAETYVKLLYLCRLTHELSDEVFHAGCPAARLEVHLITGLHQDTLGRTWKTKTRL